VEANVASTAALVLGEEAPAWLTARGLPARLVRESGEVELAGSWPEGAA
jgi:thiamine biosynthesis lipoprotein